MQDANDRDALFLLCVEDGVRPMLESSRRRHPSGHSFPRIDSPKNAGCFAEPLSGPVRLVVPTVSLCEVFRVVLRERGEDDAIRAAALMRRGREVLLTSAPALEAAPRTDRPGFFRLFSQPGIAGTKRRSANESSSFCRRFNG